MSCAVFAAAPWLVSVDANYVLSSSDHPALSRIARLDASVVYERKDQAEIRIPLGTRHFRFANPEIQCLQNNLRFRSTTSHTLNGLRLETLRRALEGITRTRCAKPMERSSFPARRSSSTMAMTGSLIRSTTATSKIGYTTFFS